MADFKDYFSSQSTAYSQYRPHYPDQFYQYLTKLCPEHDLAWDCATGNGQAARGLSRYFKEVHATDASDQQIAAATGPDNIHFKVADAANSGLKAQSVDLITVAQALHWFDLDPFYHEAKTILKKNGLLAVWCYGSISIDDQVDPLFLQFYNDVVGPFWPHERLHIENGYADLDFPFEQIKTPEFQIDARWSLDDFLGFLRTWSATVRYINAKGHDPVSLWQEKFKMAWGNDQNKKIFWPLTLLIGHQDQ